MPTNPAVTDGTDMLLFYEEIFFAEFFTCRIKLR